MRFVAGLGRRSGRDTAGRGAVAERHREDVAGRGAVAKRHREDVAGRGAVAKLLAGAPQWQRYYWPGAPWRSCCRQPQEGITTKKESDP